jgi:hypothetical protein
MAIDLSHYLLSMTQAAKILPGRPNCSTMWRWWRRGIHGHKLETVLIGGRRYTSRAAIEAFIAATTASAGGVPSESQVSRQRQREKEDSKSTLDQAGI